MIRPQVAVGEAPPAVGQPEGDVELDRRARDLEQDEHAAGREELAGVLERRDEVGGRVDDVRGDDEVEGVLGESLLGRIALDVEHRRLEPWIATRTAARACARKTWRDIGEDVARPVDRQLREDVRRSCRPCRRRSRARAAASPASLPAISAVTVSATQDVVELRGAEARVDAAEQSSASGVGAPRVRRSRRARRRPGCFRRARAARRTARTRVARRSAHEQPRLDPPASACLRCMASCSRRRAKSSRWPSTTAPGSTSVKAVEREAPGDAR